MSPDRNNSTRFPRSLLVPESEAEWGRPRTRPYAELTDGDELSAAESADRVPLNLEELHERCMGRLEFAERLLASFEKRFPVEVLEISKSLEDKDLPRLARLAHQLSGTAANICAPTLLEIMQKVEETIRQGQLSETARWLARLKPEWERFTEYRASNWRGEQQLSRKASRANALHNGQIWGESNMRVLVVEDDPDALEMLENALVHFDYEVSTVRDGLEAQEMVRSGHYRLIVSDWEMPGMTGVELCRYVRQRASSEYTYFILLTLRTGRHNVIDGLRAGADEFLSKPFDPTELEMRLRVAERILSLESRDVVIFSLAKLAEARDTDTGAHLERIREYCLVLAQHLARMQKFNSVLDGDYIQLLYLTSPLHDIGKVGIPDNVLLKPGRLTPEEFEIMKEHVLIGGRTLDAAVKAHPRAKYLQVARDIAFTHHEKFDGTGYPYHLHGEEIPLCGRIVALSDVYDALTTRRVYKPAYSHEVAKNIILEGSGTHFDPDVVDAFLASEEQFLSIKDRLDDTDFEAEEAGGPDREVSAGADAAAI